jgi:hypothetical protein
MKFILTKQNSFVSNRPNSVQTSNSNISSSIIEYSLSSDDPIDTLKDFLVRICKDSCESVLDRAEKEKNYFSNN